MIQGKDWGTTERIWDSLTEELDRLVIKEGYCSSIHEHAAKHNLFYVESGRLEVLVFRGNGLVDRTVLEAGMKTIVPPGEKHQFHALEGTVAYELGYVHISGTDIKRYTQGGRYDPARQRLPAPAA